MRLLGEDLMIFPETLDIDAAVHQTISTTNDSSALVAYLSVYRKQYILPIERQPLRTSSHIDGSQREDWLGSEL
jgi:hypothetical protein